MLAHLAAIVAKAIAASAAAILLAHAPASHHKRETFRAEVQCISVRHHDRWQWKCETKGAFQR